MNCTQVKENLTAYLHGELDKNDVLAIHQHLSVCERCLQDEIELRRTGRILESQQFDLLPKNFDMQLLRRLKQQKMRAGDRTGLKKMFWTIAATLLVTLGTEFFIYQYVEFPRQTKQFADFSTTQAVFQSSKYEDSSMLSRYLEKFDVIESALPFNNGI